MANDPGLYRGKKCALLLPYLCRTGNAKKTGKGILRLDFVNVFYAEGVQEFSLDLKVIKRSEHYMIADLMYGPKGADRTAIISVIEYEWIKRFCPELWYFRPPSSLGPPYDHGVHLYLCEVFGFGKKA